MAFFRCFYVDATGFEPATSASRTQRSTKLSHASICVPHSCVTTKSIILKIVGTVKDNL